KLSVAMEPESGFARPQLRGARTGPAKKTILMVFNTVPYPLRSTGISLRYLPVLQYLSKRHHVDVVIIGNPKTDVPNAEAVKAHCRKMSFIQNPRYNVHSFTNRTATKINTMLTWTP